MVKPLIAGNWKMHGLAGDLDTVATIASVADFEAGAVDVLLCLPATLIADAARLTFTSTLVIGGQDCHSGVFGAHTGDISATMLHDAGARAVIVGHSERRRDHRETDLMVSAKAAAAVAAGLLAIVCVGETASERSEGRTLDVVLGQLKASLAGCDAENVTNIAVAYEPVWAIGTGLTPTPEDIAAVHVQLRRSLIELFGDAGTAVRILYGGSAKPDNAAQLLTIPDVDGALVGGASLKAADFASIIRAGAEIARNRRGHLA
ncbi:MAG: triose-phosphate isomerase [Hyphomicrobiaceae bacterium]